MIIKKYNLDKNIEIKNKDRSSVPISGFLDATCELSGLVKKKHKFYDCLDGGGTF